MIHSILIIGQSNMAGRGRAEEIDPIVNDNVYVMRNGRWRPKYIPVNPDRSFSGVNLVETFADLYAKDHGVQVGVIPCADGGTNLDQWCAGGLLFDHACYMAELASRTSTIAAVLWHQGEGDCAPERYPHYEKKLTAIFKAFRERLNLHDVPFLVGGLGDSLKDREVSPSLKNYPHINAALQAMAQKDAKIGFVSAEGLTDNGDYLHFNAKSLYEFGARYYAEFVKLEDKNKVFEEKPGMDDATAQNWMELL